ncbi:DUF3710 domain-containing protein [Frankia sp. AgPm24]|uniref:DUF3710 domain-containing protein n=1 Tax=Frankia sp. AgPm24 TaxID=631128 RepID=UPI00200FF5EF|nr:DUF3710 domain-containing protein [Frankia sp. AgPm24]MCK9925310.1 DUF3710 domain-containing protein [Frankia sp. AgPm24]
MRPGRWASSRQARASHAQPGPERPEHGPESAHGSGFGLGTPTGPYDLAEAPNDGWPRVDLGSLVVPVRPGSTVGVSGRRTARGERETVAVVGLGQIELVLAAFAAPRSHPLWGALRARLSISSRAILAIAGLPADAAAGPVQETAGPCGPELCLLAGTGDERRLVRVLGFDGPRWLLRATLTIPLPDVPAASATSGVPAAGSLTGDLATGPGPSADVERMISEVLRQVIVLRGGRAVPSGGALPLTTVGASGEWRASVQRPDTGQHHELDDQLGRVRPNGAIVGVARERTPPEATNLGPYLTRDLYTWA